MLNYVYYQAGVLKSISSVKTHTQKVASVPLQKNDLMTQIISHYDTNPKQLIQLRNIRNMYKSRSNMDRFLHSRDSQLSLKTLVNLTVQTRFNLSSSQP